MPDLDPVTHALQVSLRELPAFTVLDLVRANWAAFYRRLGFEDYGHLGAFLFHATEESPVGVRHERLLNAAAPAAPSPARQGRGSGGATRSRPSSSS